MGAVETSIVTLLFIFGFGLCGASYSTCKDTLSSNGFNLTDSQYQVFYEAANDQANINYINANESFFAESWNAAAEQEDFDIYDWYRSNIKMTSNNNKPNDDSKPSYWVNPPNVDETWFEQNTNSSGEWVEDSSTSSSSSITVPKRDLEDIFFQQYGPVDKMIKDGHGGYYIGTFVPSSGNSLSPGAYVIRHYFEDGKSALMQQVGLPYLKDKDRNDYAVFDVDYDVVENEDGSQTVTVYRFTKQVNPDVAGGYSVNHTAYPLDVRFFEESTEPIEEIKGDEVTLPLNPDGTITLPDGTVLVPNEDGSFTIGGTKYVPKQGVLSPTDLLKQLLDLQKKLEELENELKFEKEKEQDKDIDEAIDEAAEQYDGDLMEFVLNSRITQVFPFCLPFDFVRGVKLFSAAPVAPVFDIPFNIPKFLLFPGVETSIHFDLTDFKEISVLSRWLSTVGFIFFLIEITPKIVKGAGS